MGHVTLTTPLYGWFVILRLGYDIVHLCTKFDDSSFSQCTDIIRAFWGSQNFKCVHVTLITPLLWVICPSYDGFI